MKKYGKHTILGWSWRTLMWVVLTPIVLFLILAALIYCPPVQKWAVDKAADWLGEEMQMEVSVENVRLKFPLDLSMGGMLAIQEGDTVLSAEELRLGVQVRPLFDKKVNVDDIILRNADVNTRGIIDAALIRGHIGELKAYTHGVDLSCEMVTVNQLALKNADLLIALPDTVPPDTVDKEPTKWKIDLQDIDLEKTKFALSLPQAKGYDISDLYGVKNLPHDLDSYFDKAQLRAFVDLENGVYTVNDLKAKGSKARFQDSFDAENISVECDSIRFAQPMDMYVNINKLEGKEKCGLNFKDVHGRVLMNDKQLVIPGMSLTADDSQIDLDMTMDLNAWDEKNPGQMALNLRSVIGKSDAINMTRYVDRFLDEESRLDAVREMIQQYMPVKPTPLTLSLSGNAKDLHLDSISTNVDGIGKLDGKVRMNGDVVSLDMNGRLAGGDAKVRGEYNMADESYDLDMDLVNFNVNKYVDLPEHTRVTGTLRAKGKGFDIYSPSTAMDATACIRRGNYGKIDLSTVVANVKLKRQLADVKMSCNNRQLVTDCELTGRVKKGAVEGRLNIDLPYVNLQSMGYADDKMIVRTNGKVDFYSNLGNLFRIDSYISGLDVETADEELHTEDFELFAESLNDTTSAVFSTGDLALDFHAPDNIFRIMEKGEKLGKVFAKQTKNRDINLDILRTYMPQATLHVKSGDQNPFATYLAANGISFDNVAVDLQASPELGVVGNGSLWGLQKDSMRLEKTYFEIHQEGRNLVFASGVECKEQAKLPEFKATLEGYLGAKVADVHLKYYDYEGVKGVDLGAHVVGLDSVWHLTLYPEQPVIAYRLFELSKDSYVDFYREKGHPIIGDIRLKSLTDDSDISITGIDNEREQRALVEVNDFNMSELAKVMPLLPKMNGLFSIDAAYQEHEDKFWVDGIMDIKDFEYEGMHVGDIGSLFTYEPEGLSVHKLEGDISFEGTDVITLNGMYDTSGNGELDADLELLDIPMQMLSPFVPDQMAVFDGNLAGFMCINGPMDRLKFDGYLLPDNVHAFSPYYSVNLRLSNDTVKVENSKIEFDKYAIYGAGENPLELSGNVDFRNFDNIPLSLTLVGRNFKLIDSKRTSKSVLFGNAYGDIYARVTGTSNDIVVRGALNVLNTTNLTYLMTETALSQGDRLDDIVTFVDFSIPPDSTREVEPNTIMGVDMNMRLNIEDGTRVRCEFSADRQSYVNVQGGGSLSMVYTPEGVMNVQGRITVNEGEMKYTLPVIPLKTFTLQQGSYVDFNGDMYNPSFNIAAVSRTKAAVSTEGSSTRSVAFDVGMKITNTLNDMGLAFTLDAPEDGRMQEELNNYSDEEKGKLAVALLATGMYVADNNTSALNANTALSTFLQSELNNITGRALNSIVDVSLGMDQTTYSDGSTGTDYSFKFSKRFFSDRLSVVIGGRVSDNKMVNQSTGIGSFIDDVSLEWRIDPAATRSVRIFHNKDYNNVFEGLLEKNGAGVVLRKKMDSLSELMFWKRKKKE